MRKYKDASEIQEQLRYCTGTQSYHRISPFARKVVATDGVVQMAQLCGAFWLASDIALHSQSIAKKHEDGKYFQAWKFTAKDRKGTLVGTDGNGNVYQTEEYDMTDFPLDEIDIWVEPTYMESEGEILVMMLPTEH